MIDPTRYENPRPGVYNFGRVIVTDVIGGYAHETVIGTYADGVEGSEISGLFAHPHFGGRWDLFDRGHFRFKRHTD